MRVAALKLEEKKRRETLARDEARKLEAKAREEKRKREAEEQRRSEEAEIERQRAENERILKAQAERDRLERERLERERLERERLEMLEREKQQREKQAEVERLRLQRLREEQERTRKQAEGDKHSAGQSSPVVASAATIICSVGSLNCLVWLFVSGSGACPLLSCVFDWFHHSRMCCILVPSCDYHQCRFRYIYAHVFYPTHTPKCMLLQSCTHNH